MRLQLTDSFVQRFSQYYCQPRASMCLAFDAFTLPVVLNEPVDPHTILEMFLAEGRCTIFSSLYANNENMQLFYRLVLEEVMTMQSEDSSYKTKYREVLEEATPPGCYAA